MDAKRFDRGRKDRLDSRPLPPPNRTCGSPASGSPVGGSPPRGLTGQDMGCTQREQPKLGKEGHPRFEGRQHALRPNRRFRPRPAAANFSRLLSPLGHSRGWSFHRSVLHASTFLPPFAPRTLLRFQATMRALTPARLSRPNRSPCFTHTAVLTIPPPTTPAAPVTAFTRYPSARQVSPLPGSRLRHSLAGSPDGTGRIGFVILRTGRSPPVALHLASRRRSYSRLQAGERMPGGDFHPSDGVRLQAHECGALAPLSIAAIHCCIKTRR